MLKQKKWIGIVIGTMAAFVLALGAASFFFTSTSQAAASDGFDSGEVGQFHDRGMRGEKESFLADALGISVEELQAAREEARQAGLEQAVAEGLITQEQADEILSGERKGFRGKPAGKRGLANTIDRKALLADALGITVEELEAAHQKAGSAYLEQAIAEGRITQEQAELMQAHQALRNHIDKEALMAKALGISVEELQAAHAEGKSLRTLIEELGLDRETVQANMKTAREEAIGQAVADGVITQEQAEQILSQEGRGLRGHGGRDGLRGPGNRGGEGFRAPRGNDSFRQQSPASNS